MGQVVYTKNGEELFSKLDPPIQKRVDEKLSWLADNFSTAKHEGLTGKLAGSFKLRVGDYRVIYDIESDTNTIVVLLVGHRSDVYDL